MGMTRTHVMSLLVWTVLLATSSITPSAQQKTLRDLAREHQGLEGGFEAAVAPVEMRTLVQRSTLVARVTVDRVDSYLVRDDQLVMSDYTVLVLDVDHSAGPEVRLGERVVVSRLNGDVMIDGYTIHWESPSFPNFRVGEEYVLFLGDSRFPKDERYQQRHGVLKRFDVLSEGWGAFKIGLGSIRQVFPDEDAGWNRGRPASVETFQGELRARVAEVRESAR